MRVPLTIHRFAGIRDVRQAVQRRPGELLQALHRDSSHHIVQLGSNRYRFELVEGRSGRWEGALVEVPFRHMTWRQQLLAIVRTLCRLLPCGSVRAARVRHTVGHFTQPGERAGLVPELGFVPADDRLAWLYHVCRTLRTSPNPNVDMPASLDFRDAAVSDEDLKLIDKQLCGLPDVLSLDQLELILEPLCSLALARGTPARTRRDGMVASLCDKFAGTHRFDMATAKRIVQLSRGLCAGPAFQRWLEDGATQLADAVVAAVNPSAMSRPATPLADADANTLNGFNLISRHLKDLAAILPGLPPAAVSPMLRCMADIADLPDGDRVSRIELTAIVARAHALALERHRASDEAPDAPRKPARVWGKRADMPIRAHQ
ncbi:hypothetical protein OJJOAM_001790 [Cupriavidus sp. H18C1]|uniref:hypothetical protein n=1 Tax=Cupriavidus sp. H18C1 TaxID=3241601 RepID=UPI003BB883AF